jgi:hypothetical protein
MFVYIHIFIHICVYLYMDIYIYIFMYIYIYLYVYLYVLIYVGALVGSAKKDNLISSAISELVEYVRTGTYDSLVYFVFKIRICF